MLWTLGETGLTIRKKKGDVNIDDKEYRMSYSTDITFVGFENYLKACIPQVGQVIAGHAVFSGLVLAVRKGRMGMVRPLWRHIKDTLVDYVNAKGICGRGDVTPGDRFSTPFVESSDTEGLGDKIVVVNKELINEFIWRCTACVVRDEDLVVIGDHFSLVARFFGELSIDSAKKLVPVECEYLDGLGSPLLSREKNDAKFNLTLDWRNKKVIKKLRKRGGDKEVKFFDELQRVRDIQLTMLSEQAEKWMERTQEIPEFAYARAKKGFALLGETEKAFVLQACGAYMALCNAKAEEIETIRTGIHHELDSNGPGKHAVSVIIRDAVKVVSDEYRKKFRLLTDHLRWVTRGIDPVTRAEAVLWAAAKSGDTEDEKRYTSSILTSLLPEELILWVVSMGKEGLLPVHDEVEVPVRVRVFQDRQEVSFEEGFASEGTCAAYAEEAINGVWTVHESEHGWVARQSLELFIKVPAGRRVMLVKSKSVELDKARKLNPAARDIVLDFTQGGSYTFVLDRVPTVKHDVYRLYNTYSKPDEEGYMLDQGLLKELIVSPVAQTDEEVRQKMPQLAYVYALYIPNVKGRFRKRNFVR